ncbi:MAG: hypothetical protein ACRD96_20100, partial [Bryobacteraceae bacterium]
MWLRSREWAILFLFAAAVLVQVLIPPVVGMADNGDFPRIMGRFGITYTAEDHHDRYFRYFNRTWRFDPATRWVSGHVSSESALVAAALPLNRLFFSEDRFDIRSLGLLHATLFLAGPWALIVFSRRFGPAARTLALALPLWMWTDAGYIAYFNSFYSESASYVFLLALLACLLLVMEEPRLGALAGFAAAALLFVAAKPQNALAGVCCGLFALRLSPLREDRRWKVACSALAPVLLAGAGMVYFTRDKGLDEATRYIAVIEELLGHSPNPRQDLRDLGLDPALARYAGVSPYAPDSPRYDPEFRLAFFDQFRP